MKKSTKKTKRRSGDVNVTAFDIVNELTAKTKPGTKRKPSRKPTKARKSKARG